MKLQPIPGRQLVSAIILLYSLLVLATATPALKSFPSWILAFYYLFVPGFCFSLILNENYGIFQRILYSVPISMALILTIFALGHPPMSINYLRFDLVVPILSMIVLSYAYLRPRFRQSNSSTV